MFDMVRELSKWHSLRSLGNSQVAKLSYLIPMLGYFILFNRQLVESLKLHTHFCGDGCTVTWRLEFFYFGGCAIAVATFIYALRCPTIVKKFDSASELYNNNQGFLSDIRNFQMLVLQTTIEGAVFDGDTLISNMRNMEPAYRAPLLSSAASTLYISANKARPVGRYLCLVLFGSGAVLIFLPALITFMDVVRMLATRWGL